MNGNVNDVSLREYFDLKFNAIDTRLLRMEDYQKTLATREDLAKAISDNTEDYTSLRAMFWTACVTAGGAIAWLINKIWDLVPHKIQP